MRDTDETLASHVGTGRALKSLRVRMSIGLLFACMALFLLFFNGRLGIIDGELMFETTQSIADRASLAITPHPFASVGADGRSYSKYGPMQSLCALPLYLLGRTVASHLSPSSAALVERAAVALFNPIILSILAVAVFWFGLGLGFSHRRALAAALLTVTGTSLFYLSKTFNSEPLTALFLVLAFYELLQFRLRQRIASAAWAGVFLGCCIATRQVAGLAIPLCSLYLWWIARSRWPAIGAFLVPIAVSLAGLAAYNAARFGNPLHTGYGNEGFSTPVYFGLVGLLASPRCGLLFYSPVLLLAPFGVRRLFRAFPWEVALVTGLAAVWLLSAAAWWCWWGGWAVGPRLFLPVFPLLALLSVAAVPPAASISRARKSALLVLALLNLAIQLLPLLVAHPEWKQIETYARGNDQAAFWSFRYMPLLWQARNLRTVLVGSDPRDSAAPHGEAAPSATDEAVNSRFNAPVIDAWPSYLRIMGVRPIIPVAGLLILLLCLAATVLELRRTLGRLAGLHGSLSAAVPS